MAKHNIPSHGPILSGLYYAKKVNNPDDNGEQTFQEGHAAVWKLADPNINGKRDIAMNPIIIPDTQPAPLVEADCIGAGCMMVHRSVFERMTAPYFKWQVGEADLIQWDEKYPWRCSEDFFFCLKAAEELGVKPIVLSGIRCGHIGMGKILPHSGKFSLSLQ